jgi:glycine oxidase
VKLDVAVVGGGVAGAAIAWRFAQRKLRVGLFDRSVPNERSGPASPAAAGILCAQVEGEGPGPFFDLLRAAEQAHARLAKELAGSDLGYRTCGVLRVARDEAELADLQRERTWQLERGLEVDALDPAALHALEPALSRDLVGASLFPAGGQIDARALLAELLARGESAGVARRRVSVEGVRVEAGRVQGLTLPGEIVSAPMVVVAAGAWSAQLAGVTFVADAVFPVSGQMLQLAAPAPRLSRVVFGAGGYLVPYGERVMVGSTMDRTGFQPRALGLGSAILAERAVTLWPALADMAAALQAPHFDTWFGFRPATPDGLPALGPTPIEGLHLAVGFLRNGILLAPLAAELVVQAALGDASAIPRPFAAARLLC